jgi:transglutaminase-like putative cysteine protease
VSPVSWRSHLVDAAFAVVIAALALLGLDAIFSGYEYLWVGLAGAVVAVAVSAITVRLPVLVTVAAGIVVYGVIGVALVFRSETVAGVLPTLSGLTDLERASLHGWRDIVTTLPPVTGRHLLVVAYLIGFAGTLTGLQLAWRTRTAVWPLLGPVAMLAAVILLGTDGSSSAYAGGVAFAAVTLAWSVVRRRRLNADQLSAATGGVHRSGGTGRSRFAAVGVLAVATLATGLVALTPLGTGSSRYVLRDHVQPPFDVSAYPSPLSSYRRYEVNDKETVLFTVSGLPTGARIRLATMDSYDGVVWGVAGGPGHTQGSGVFQRVGDPIPVPTSGAAATVTVTLGSLGGVWLPTVGELRSIRFAGARATDLTDSFRYNLITAAAVVPAALAPSDRYTMSVVLPPIPDVASLTGLPSGAVTQPDLKDVPDEVATRAESWTRGQSGPIKQLQAIVSQMRNGAFSDGTVDSSVISPPGAGEHRIQTFLGGPELVGDGEQYAATLALMARSLGIPARVVLGVVPPADGFDGQVTGHMVSAWVEVNIAGSGWVPFDPTPPVTNKPKPQPTEQLPNTLTRIIAPPVVEPQAANEQPGDGVGSNPPKPPSKLSLWWDRIFAIGTYGGFEALGLALLMLAVVIAKRIRRSRRRSRGSPLDRVTAAWTELVDRLRDLGIRTRATGTRRQRAELAGFPQVAWIATSVDEAVFAPGEPAPEVVDRLWSDVDTLLVRLRLTRSRSRRFRAAVDPRSLLPTVRPASIAAWVARRIPKPRRAAILVRPRSTVR